MAFTSINITIISKNICFKYIRVVASIPTPSYGIVTTGSVDLGKSCTTGSLTHFKNRSSVTVPSSNSSSPL